MILLRPVDCDEILGVFTSDGLSFTRKDIHAAFDVLHTSGKRGGFRIETSLFNVPGETGWYVPVGFFHKGFVSSHVQAVCDNGHHEPTSATDPTIYDSLFTYLHEHNVEYHLWRQRLKRKLKGLVDPDDPEKLRQYLAGDRPEGAHAAQAYSMSEQEYYERYNQDVRLYVGDRTSPRVVVEGPGVPPSLWDGDAYRARHPDVAQIYALGSLQHYLRCGFTEGRALR